MSTRSPIPIGVNLSTMGVTAQWWLDSALRVEAAGFRTAWAWDHFQSFSAEHRAETPVLECWTTLAAVAAQATTLRVGSFVANVMNRHPSVLARQAMTVADIAGTGARVELGVGIGGHLAEHRSLGIEFPEPRERAARLVEQLSVLRALMDGGPVDFDGDFYRLEAAVAKPVPEPRPRLIVGGETPAGARIAANHADALTTFALEWEPVVAAYAAELQRLGRSRDDVQLLVALEVEPRRGYADPEPDLFKDLAAVAARWHERGADEIVLHWVGPGHLDAVLAAGERAGLEG